MSEIKVSSQHLPFFLKKLQNQGFSGEVLFYADTQNAKIYFAEGKIIWAFATGQQESFQSILIREHQFSATEISGSIKQARSENKKSISYAIQLLGLQDEELVRSIVERHTRSALHTLLSWAETKAALKALKANDYSFVFTVEELITKPVLATSSAEPSSAISPPSSPPTPNKPVVKMADASPVGISEAYAQANSGLDCSLLKQVAEATPGLVSLSVVECNTGMPIYYYPADFGMDVELASAYFRNIFSQSADTWDKFMQDADGSAPLIALELHTGNGQVILNHLAEVNFLICLVLTNEADRDKVIQEIFSAVAKLKLL